MNYAGRSTVQDPTGQALWTRRGSYRRASGRYGRRVRMPALLEATDEMCPQCGGGRDRTVVDGFIEIACETCEYTLTLVVRPA